MKTSSITGIYKASHLGIFGYVIRYEQNVYVGNIYDHRIWHLFSSDEPIFSSTKADSWEVELLCNMMKCFLKSKIYLRTIGNNKDLLANTVPCLNVVNLIL